MTASETWRAGAPADEPIPAPGLRIGPLAVDPPVVLAPMAGVTNVAYRRLCRDFGAALYVSEMVSARALVEGGPRTKRMLQFDESGVRSVQLYGVRPEVVAEGVRILVGEHGVEHVDLNFGCPAGKVTRKGGGAALPVRRVLFRDIVAAAVGAAGDVPVTAKMRIGVDDTRRTFVEAGRIAEGEGAAAVALHARTAEQLYSGTADWTAIAELKAEVTSVPVLGNGDIWEADDAVAMMESTGCDGVVVGRGCLGRPWLFRDLVDRFAGRSPQPPPRLGGVADVLRRHADLLTEAFGEERAMIELRKHVRWYLTGLPVGQPVRAALGLVATRADLERLLGDLDPDLELPPSAARAARGHTHGPRPVTVPPGWYDDPDDPTPPAGAELLVSGG